MNDNATIKDFVPSVYDLFFGTWYKCRYGSYFNGFDLISGFRKNEKCFICGIEQTWPTNLVKFFTIANIPDDRNEKIAFITYCYNHGWELPNDLVDCHTGNKVEFPKMDRFYKTKHYYKKFLLDVRVIVKFLFLLIRNAILWYIIFPIRLKRDNYER